MDKNWHAILGAGLIAVGLVLLLNFGDTEFLWFRGQPLGIVLMVVGAFDVADSLRRRTSPEP